jgi:DNA-binding SARP family transcriptional activator
MHTLQDHSVRAIHLQEGQGVSLDTRALSSRFGSRERRAILRKQVQVVLLHGFELTVNGEPLSASFGAQRVIGFLALSDRPCLRMYVAGTLWPDVSERRASSSLRSTLWRMRWPGCRPVVATSTHIALASDVAVDLREAVTAARLTLDASAEVSDVERLLVLLSGDLLPGWYDDWVLTKREWFRQLRLHALESLSERLIGDGRFDQAVEAALLAVAGEPLRESAHRALVQAHIAEGNWGEAVRDYVRYRDLLRRELGVAPSPLMSHLVDRLMP